jgi:hypothetical protein
LADVETAQETSVSAPSGMTWRISDIEASFTQE